MKQLLSFIKKEFYHIFRDVRTMIIVFGIPIAQLLIFGTVIKNDIKDVHVAIYDQSKDETTKELIAKILSSDYFILERNLNNLDEVDEIFQAGVVKQVIVFENDFERKLKRDGNAAVQLILDASEPNTAKLIASYTSGIIRDFVQKENENLVMPMQIDTRNKMYYNENLESVYLFVPGLMALILMLISAMMTSISITKEKEMGTMEILLVSPLKPVQIIIGKVTPYLVLGFIDALAILGIGYFVFGVPIHGSLILLMAETLLFIFMALSLGIMISTVAKNQMIAMFISMIGLMLPTILLSGFIFAIENMPVILQWLSNVMPARWFVIIIKNIMLKGVGMNFVWKETLILLGMTVFFIFISVRKFKIRLD
jgi:ABC-2 type transport system permease protein